MRRALLVLPVLLVVLTAGCGGSDKAKTPTASAPPATISVTVPTTRTPATTPTQAPPSDLRKPKLGEGQITVTGNVASGQTRRLPGGGDAALYTYIELQPDDGTAALRVGAAGDLDIDPRVRDAIIDPRCGGRLRGTFTVAAAPARETAFDWELVSARLLNDCNRA